MVLSIKYWALIIKDHPPIKMNLIFFFTPQFLMRFFFPFESDNVLMIKYVIVCFVKTSYFLHMEKTRLHMHMHSSTRTHIYVCICIDIGKPEFAWIYLLWYFLFHYTNWKGY